MLTSLLNEPIFTLLSFSTFITLLATGVIIIRGSSPSGLAPFVFHSIYPSIGFIIGGIASLSIYSNNISLVYSEGYYLALLIFSMPIMYTISFTVLFIAGFKSKPKLIDA